MIIWDVPSHWFILIQYADVCSSILLTLHNFTRSFFGSAGGAIYFSTVYVLHTVRTCCRLTVGHFAGWRFCSVAMRSLSLDWNPTWYSSDLQCDRTSTTCNRKLEDFCCLWEVQEDDLMIIKKNGLYFFLSWILMLPSMHISVLGTIHASHLEGRYMFELRVLESQRRSLGGSTVPLENSWCLEGSGKSTRRQSSDTSIPMCNISLL